MPEIEEISRHAGQAILAYYQSGELSDTLVVNAKQDDSPVTQADLAASALIITALEKLTPNIPIVCEETYKADDLSVLKQDQFWLVDPLDGTKEFIRGAQGGGNSSGEFTVNIALIQNGVPVLGYVYAPVFGRGYSGIVLANQREAWQQSAGISEPLVVKEAEPTDLSQLRVVASKSHLSQETRQFLETHGMTQTVNVGSSLKFCLLAEGKADIYPRFGPTSQWDTAAGHAVLMGAGGDVSRTDGTPLMYGVRPDLSLGESEILNPWFLATTSKSLTEILVERCKET